MSAVRTLIKLIDGLNEHLGRTLAWLLVALVLAQFSVVVARYAFSAGSIAWQESVLYLHVMVFMGAAGYTLKHNRHVRVDIFYNRMSPRGRAAVDLFGSLFLLLPTFGFILYQSWAYVGRSFALQEASPEVGGLPYVYVIKGFILVLAVTMILQGIAQAGRSLLVLSAREGAPAGAQPGSRD